MAIIFEPEGDILNSVHQTLVCPVNTEGVMGSGLALAMANRYKGLLFNYRKACRNSTLAIGNVWTYQHNSYQQILCFPTKEDWRNPSELPWIQTGLTYVAKNWRTLGIKSIVFPMIGCGKGGLDWKDVCPLIVKSLGHLPIPVIIIGPDPTVDTAE